MIHSNVCVVHYTKWCYSLVVFILENGSSYRLLFFLVPKRIKENFRIARNLIYSLRYSLNVTIFDEIFEILVNLLIHEGTCQKDPM